MNKDAFYFPHFCHARHDRKMKRIVKELGVEGYGIYFMLLEVLREQADFKYPLQDIDLLADEFNTSEPKVKTIVCNYKLFEIDEKENFFSIKLIEYMQPYLRMREQRRIAGVASGKARSRNMLEQPLNENEQSKVKESKVKERNTCIFDFDKLWIKYPKKLGKKEAIRHFNASVKTQEDMERIEKALKNYSESVEKTDHKYIMNGKTWFNNWEDWVDYVKPEKLDDSFESFCKRTEVKANG